MLKKFVLAGLLVATSACASLHTTNYVGPFALQLEVQERNGNAPTETYDIGGDELFDSALPKLKAIADEIGYKIVAAGELTMNGTITLWGYTDKDKKIIYLSLNQSPNNFIHTFIHELSHAMQPMPLSPEGQVFAETVAALVMDNLGAARQTSSYAYIQQFPTHAEVFDRYWMDINNLVQFFLDRLKPKA